VATSGDGVRWTDRSATAGITSEPTKCLIFANGKFVQVGWHQPPYYSTDGLTWTPAQSASSVYTLYNHSTGLAYGNGLLVLVVNSLDFTYGGSIMTSSDGVTWTRLTGADFACLCFGNGVFMGLVEGSQSGPYYDYVSTDGGR
jgi:hypothetical protein